MFDGNSTIQGAASELRGDSDEQFSIETVLLCSDLPRLVRTARISRIYDRLVDANEISRLTDTRLLSGDKPGQADTLMIRRKALRRYLGSFLTCVYIRLPGCAYTVEIDPDSRTVVHWECQQT